MSRLLREGAFGRNVKRSPAAIAFGKVLREMRTRRRMSLETVASLSGVEKERLADIERGLREPTLVLLFELASALEVSASELIAQMELKLD